MSTASRGHGPGSAELRAQPGCRSSGLRAGCELVPCNFCARPAPLDLHNLSGKLLEGWTQASAAGPGSTGLQLSPLVGFKICIKNRALI